MAAFLGLGTMASVGGINGVRPEADGTRGSDPDPDPDPDPAPVDCLVTEPEGLVWRLAFAEDFIGSDLDVGDWRVYDSPGKAGYGLRLPSAVALRDGRLVITAEMRNGELVSGGMAHRRDQTYGRWEFRVRTDPDRSEATSGVVLTWPRSENWPIDGENDVYETLRDPDRKPFMTFIHHGADNSQVSLTHDADATEWQIMAMEWSADRLAIYRNGSHVGGFDDPEVIPDVPHHLTIQLDAWADEMGEPVEMEVDWVRVHALDPTATEC